MNGRNPDLSELHTLLIDTIDKLVQEQEAATDPDTIRALGREIREVGFRMTMVQQLLFKRQTQEITEAVAEVRESDARLKAAMAEIDRLNNFIKTITSFLGLVDKVIDLAKLL